MGTIGLITRSRTTGYKVFPLSDVGSWWEQEDAYRKLMLLEAPCMVLRGKGGSGGEQCPIDFFLSGIKSEQREDHVGTPIRYSLFGAAETDDEISSLIAAVKDLCVEKKPAQRKSVDLRELAGWLDRNVGNNLGELLDANEQLDRTVEEINSLTARISKLNAKIARQHPGDRGYDVGRRDELIEELSRQIGIAVITDDDGVAEVSSQICIEVTTDGNGAAEVSLKGLDVALVTRTAQCKLKTGELGGKTVIGQTTHGADADVGSALRSGGSDDEGTLVGILGKLDKLGTLAGILGKFDEAWRDYGPSGGEGGDVDIPWKRTTVGRLHDDAGGLIAAFTYEVKKYGGNVLFLNLANEDQYAELPGERLLGILKGSEEPKRLKKKRTSGPGRGGYVWSLIMTLMRSVIPSARMGSPRGRELASTRPRNQEYESSAGGATGDDDGRY